MTQPTLVSILIPAHKHANFAQTLASARAQSYPNLEIVVSDDSGGTEIERIAHEHPDSRIRYSRHPNPSGIDAGYRRALELARGEWALFLDDDDIIYPTAVVTLADTFAASPGASMVYAGYDYVNEIRVANKPRRTPHRVCPPPGRTTRSAKQFFLTFRDCTPLTITILLDVAAARRAAVFTATGPVKGADWDAWLRIGALGNVVTIDEVLGCHYYRANSFSARDSLAEDLASARFIDTAASFAVEQSVLTPQEAQRWRRSMRRWYTAVIFARNAPRRRYAELARGYAHTLVHHPAAALASLPTLAAGLLLISYPNFYSSLRDLYHRLLRER